MMEIIKDFIKDNSELVFIGFFMFAMGFGIGGAVFEAFDAWKPRKRKQDET